MRRARIVCSLSVPLWLGVSGCVQAGATRPAESLSAWSHAQATPPDTGSSEPRTAARSGEPQPLLAEREEGKWSFQASAYTYFVPDDHDYVQPTITLDRDRLHLEARYNYEALDTGSLWVGWNLGGGDEEGLSWEITPMIGGVFGEATGVAPGYRGTIAWWRLELYGEGEYVIDTGDGDSFFYNWSELTIAPVDRLRVGIVTQRTRVYDTEHHLQRGLLVGLGLGRFDVTAHVFNPDDDEPVVVVSVGLGF
jgi:hypothetical protein